MECAPTTPSRERHTINWMSRARMARAVSYLGQCALRVRNEQISGQVDLKRRFDTPRGGFSITPWCDDSIHPLVRRQHLSALRKATKALRVTRIAIREGSEMPRCAVSECRHIGKLPTGRQRRRHRLAPPK
jgi:hypothetical protein